MATIIPPEAASAVHSPKPEREPNRALPTAQHASRPNLVLRYAIYAALALALYFAYPYLLKGYQTYIAGRK